MNILVAILLSLAIDLVFSSKGAQAELQETPFFAAAVASGALPKVSERVPSVPRIIDLPKSGREIGRPGGTLRILMGDQRDLRFMTLYGYSGLVVFNDKLEIIPDILESFDIDEGRIFTLHLRPGHKWSDSQPFTAEDFRYAWEDF